MTLADQLIARIRADGPISVADYMAECLMHPTLGYYQTRDPFGAQGDFTTAPEISQMFGELIGLALVQCWLDQGRPTPFTLAELGPGRGTLMADALRAARAVPEFEAAADLVLIETSVRLKARQRQALPRARWVDDTSGLPEAPLFLVANEFFDALPIRQFQRGTTGWCERLVGLSPQDALIFGLGAETEQPALAHRTQDTNDGDLVELCPAAAPMIARIATRIATHGGAALIVDYGDWRALGDTLQGVQDHRPVSPLAHPGLSDLTAHVDFEPLAQAAMAAGARHTRLTPQGVFLERLGITARAQALTAAAPADASQSIVSAHRRLTHPDEMGNLFKVFGVFPPSGPPPPGLQA